MSPQHRYDAPPAARSGALHSSPYNAVTRSSAVELANDLNTMCCRPENMSDASCSHGRLRPSVVLDSTWPDDGGRFLAERADGDTTFPAPSGGHSECSCMSDPVVPLFNMPRPARLPFVLACMPAHACPWDPLTAASRGTVDFTEWRSRMCSVCAGACANAIYILTRYGTSAMVTTTAQPVESPVLGLGHHCRRLDGRRGNLCRTVCTSEASR